jgi:DNA helicase TIP49 (TBP-interacting protein)
MNKFISATGKPHLAPGSFAGREVETNSLAGSIITQNAKGSVSVISGETGIGKTELALVVAQHLAHELPDCQLIKTVDFSL